MENLKKVQNFVQKSKKNFREFFSSVKQKFSQKRENFSIYFDDFFMCEKFFKFCGFPFLRLSQVQVEKWRKIHLSISTFSMVLQIVESLCSLAIFARNSTQFLESVENFSYVCGITVLLAKLFWIIFVHREKILGVIEKLDEHFPHHNFDQAKFNVRRYLRGLKLIAWLEIFVIFGFGVHFSCFPIETKIFGWLTSQEFEWKFILAHWYPVEASNSLGYWLVNVWSAYDLFFMLSSVIFTDLLYAGLVTITSMDFDILAEKIKKVDSIDELKYLIEIHQDLIDVTGKLEEIFSPLLLVDVFGNMGVLCTASFLFATGASPIFMMKYFPGSIGTTLHGFIQCYYAQMLTDASKSIAFAAYSTPWYESSLKFRKLVLIAMIRAQEGEELTAWKFFGVSMETFYWVLETARSYYSVLMGLYKP